MGFLQSDLFSQISWSRRANTAVLGDLFSILISVRIHILNDIQIIKYLSADTRSMLIIKINYVSSDLSSNKLELIRKLIRQV